MMRVVDRGADQHSVSGALLAIKGSYLATLARALQMETFPKYHNEVGVLIVRIGCREFK